MIPTTVRPSYRLRSKYRLITWIGLFTQLLWSVPVAYLIGMDVGEMPGATTGVLVAILLNALWFIPALWLVDRYYESLSYEIQQDEVIVRVGIITQSVKHVPYRTITNTAIKRDLLDRFLFDIGTVEVQTAGASTAQTSAEEEMVGLVDYEGIYNLISDALRQYRRIPLPATQGGDEAAPLDSPAGEDILRELRAIRVLLQEANAGRGE
jgi:membrane protein YdbS with pleckstrin-like domain